MKRLLVLGLVAALLAPTAANAYPTDGVPKLTGHAYLIYSKKIFRMNKHLQFREHRPYGLAGCKRLSKVRITCGRAYWGVRHEPDLFFVGRLTIWLGHDAQNKVWVRYRYRIRRQDYACLKAGNPKSECVKVYKKSVG